MQSEFPLIIIGGGLAGLVSAIELANAGHRVLLIEKKDYPRHKVCGEYVSNEVKPYLESIGAFPETLKPKDLHRFQLSSSSGKLAECEMQMGGFGISRYALDHFLYQKAKEAGAEVRTDSTVSDVEFADEQFQLKLSSGEEFTARVIIGAHGKRSLIDKALKRNFIAEKSSYVGIKQHFRASFPDDLVALHNFEGGYCGLSRVENDQVNFCYLTTTDVFKRYTSIAQMEQKHLSQNPFLRDFLQVAEPVFERPLVISQVSFAQKPVVENHLLMCGDAAGLIHPLCGNGMAMAIHSAQICSAKVKQFLLGKISRREMEEQYRQEWRQHFRARLRFGKIIQGMFGNNLLTGTGVRIAHSFPGMLKQLVKLSHGKEVY